NSNKNTRFLLEQFDWKTVVFENNKLFSNFGKNGLFIAAPISLGEMAEGAVIAFVPVDQLQVSIAFKRDDSALLYLDGGTIVYSSNLSVFPILSVFQQSSFRSWYFQTKSVAKNKLIISAQKKSDAYKKIYLLLPFMLMAIVLTIAISLFGTFLSAKLVSRTLEKFIGYTSKLTNDSDSVILLDANDPEEMVEIHRQFTEVMQDLLVTRNLKQNFQSILNSLNEYLVVFDIKGNTRMTNIAFDNFASKIGVCADNGFDKIIPLEHRQHALDTAIELDDFSHFYKTQDTHDKQDQVIRWSRSLFYSESGELEGVIFIGADITKTREIEKDLYVKNRAIEAASNGIVIANALEKDMPLIYVNDAFVEMTGYQKEDVVNKNCRFLQGENTDPDSIERVRSAIQRQDMLTEILLNYRKDGSQFYNHLSLTPIFDESHTLTHYLGVQMDVTAKVDLDKQLLEAKAKAEESAQLKSEFLASMSHEIRTPMNGVIGMLGLLASTPLNEKQSHYTNLAQSSAKSLLTIINDILDFSKIEAGKMDLEIIDFNLSTMLGDFIQSMAPKAHEKSLELVLDTSQLTETFIKSDAGRLRQILTNLVGNAIKFTDRGHIFVKVSLGPVVDERMTLTIGVNDTGIGIPDNKIDRLFKSFSQVDASTTRKYGGTGLGLAIVKQLCQLMGGDIQVASEIGKGSDFTAKVTVYTSAQSQRLLPEVDIANVSILLVGGSAASSLVMEKQLGVWGAQVKTVDSANGAMKLLEASSDQVFDIAILDLQLPDTDGETLAKKIRCIPRLNAMKLVLATSLSQPGDAKRFADTGFAAYFPKPATTNDLLSVLKVLVDDGDMLSQAKPLSTRHCRHSVDSGKSKNAQAETIEQTTNIDKPPADKPRILLVEDNLINQEVARGLLEAMGYGIDIANNGKEAIDILSKDNHFSIVLMDCQMPEMDGFEATQKIRQGSTLRSDITIIAMTANAMKGDKERCLDSGMNDYLSKPVDPEKLGHCLSQWLNKPDNSTLPKEEITMSDESTAVWDQEGFMKRIMNNQTIANKLIDLFKTDTPKTIAELEQAVNAENANEAGLLAHKLKGSVGNLGGIELAELAKKIEEAGKSEKIEEIKHLWVNVRPQYDRLLSTIENR
ncbi:MAG: response regulator, partial [Pseudomonadota bacterium]